ncbi:hypothetical protein Tco_0555454 [Tanacetum coccineum]
MGCGNDVVMVATVEDGGVTSGRDGSVVEVVFGGDDVGRGWDVAVAAVMMAGGWPKLGRKSPEMREVLRWSLGGTEEVSDDIGENK